MQIDVLCEVNGPDPQSEFILDRLENRLDELTSRYAGRVQLIYLDPPFTTGDRFVMKQRVGEQGYGVSRKGTAQAGSVLTLDAYSDLLPTETYCDFLGRVLRCCRELLCDTGCLYLHVDYRVSARMRLLLDDIFGESNFLNEIIWHYKSGGRAKNHFSRKHDTIFFYRKTKSHYFDQGAIGLPRGKSSRNHMKRMIDGSGKTVFTIKSGGKIYTYDEDSPIYPSDVWDDIPHLQQKDPERTGYDTQKPEALLDRIIRASSREGDLVADLFSGSGTTATVAQRLQRRFLAVDSSPHALHVLRKRLLALPPMLFSAGDIRLLWNNALIASPSQVQFQNEQKRSLVAVSLVNFLSDNSDLAEIRGAKPLDLIDYWAIGRVKNGCFEPIAQAFRSTGAGKLPLTLTTALRGPFVAHVVDAFGRQGFFTVD